MHNVVRGLGIAALNRVQIGGIEVSTVDPAEGKQINTICKGMLLTALGDDNISEEPGLWSSRTCSDRDLAVLTAF